MLACSLGLEAPWSPLIPPLCYLLNLPPFWGLPHKRPVTSQGISDGPAYKNLAGDLHQLTSSANGEKGVLGEGGTRVLGG